MTQSEHPDLTEQALNKMIEVGLSSQLQEAESLDVDIQTQPLELMQGEVEAFTFHGEGLVTKDNIRLEEVLLKTDHLALNLLKVALGEVELMPPTRASARIVLSEADLNQVLQSQYLREILKQLTICLANQNLTVDWEQGQCQLFSDGRMKIQGSFVAAWGQTTQPIAFDATLRITEGGRKVYLEQGEFGKGKSFPLPITTDLVVKLNNFFQSPQLQIRNISVFIQKMEVIAGKIVLEIKAEAKPSFEPKGGVD